jgi:hypothetical protein
LLKLFNVTATFHARSTSGLANYALWPIRAAVRKQDIHAIKPAMESRPAGHTAILGPHVAISAANAAKNAAQQIVIHPYKVP